MKPLFKRLALAMLTFLVLIGCEVAVYQSEKDNFPQSDVEQASKMTNFGFFLTVNIFDWGFGSWPSIMCVLYYLTCLKQRERAYLHVCLFCSTLFLCQIMQASFSQPLFYNMYPQVYNGIKKFSCIRRFALPSLHAFQDVGLFCYCVIDYALYCQEVDDTKVFDASLSQIVVRKKFWTAKSGSAIVLSVAFIIISSTMRIVEKLNTANQTVFGWLLGVWLACVFGFILRKPIYIHIQDVLEDNYIMKWYCRLPEIGIATIFCLLLVPFFCYFMEKNGSMFYH